MRPFFVIGPPKTGTTVFTRLLVQHPEVDSLSETFLAAPGDPSSLLAPGSAKAGGHGFTAEQVAAWREFALRDGPHPSAATLRVLVEQVFDAFAGGRPLAAIGDSWPFWLDYARVLLDAFPEARFFDTTRDPRAVYLATDPLGRDRRAEFLDWLLVRDRVFQALFANDPRVHVVRYESLVADPLGTLGAAWRFLGVDPSAGWIDYHSARDAHPGRWSWIPNATAPLDPSRVASWVSRLPEAERVPVALASRAYARRWGYPDEVPGPVGAADRVRAFLLGAELADLPPGTEGYVRTVLRRMQ